MGRSGDCSAARVATQTVVVQPDSNFAVALSDLRPCVVDVAAPDASDVSSSGDVDYDSDDPRLQSLRYVHPRGSADTTTQAGPAKHPRRTLCIAAFLLSCVVVLAVLYSVLLARTS